MTLGVLALDEGRARAAAVCFRDAVLLALHAGEGGARLVGHHVPPRTLEASVVEAPVGSRQGEALRHFYLALEHVVEGPEGPRGARGLEAELLEGIRRRVLPIAGLLPGEPRGAPPFQGRAGTEPARLPGREAARGSSEGKGPRRVAHGAEVPGRRSAEAPPLARAAEREPPVSWSACMQEGVEALDRGQLQSAWRWFRRAWGRLRGALPGDERWSLTHEYLRRCSQD